jgi:hypothetical protein
MLRAFGLSRGSDGVCCATLCVVLCRLFCVGWCVLVGGCLVVGVYFVFIVFHFCNGFKLFQIQGFYYLCMYHLVLFLLDWYIYIYIYIYIYMILFYCIQYCLLFLLSPLGTIQDTMEVVQIVNKGPIMNTIHNGTLRYQLIYRRNKHCWKLVIDFVSVDLHMHG